MKNITQTTRELQQWINWLEASLKIGLEDKQLKANVRKAIGDVLQFRKELDAALVSYNEALKLFKEIGDKLGEANTLQSLGKMMIIKAEDQLSFEKGMETIQTAMQIYEEINAMAGQINILMFLSQVTANMGQIDKALEIAQAALPMLIKAAGEEHPVTLSFKEFMKKLHEAKEK